MPRIPDSVVAACDNQALGPPARYAAGRLFELLHPASHFSQSAAFVLSPQQTVHELAALSKTFIANQDVRYPAMEACMETARNLMTTLYPRIAKWWPGEVQNLLDQMQAALAPTLSLRGPEARNALVPGIRDLVLPSALALLKAFAKNKPSLAMQLFLAVRDGMTTQPPSTLKQWNAFDADLSHLAAHALISERDGYQLALRYSERLAAGSSPQDAADALGAELAQAKESYTVALVLRGARHLDAADVLGCTQLPAPAAWPGGSGNDGKLRSFLAPLIDGQQALGVVVSVSAVDPAEAQVRAWGKAQRLRDQLLATHRARSLHLYPTALVLHDASDTVSRQPLEPGGTHRARPVAPNASMELAPALRFAALARDESMTVMRSMHAWVALEKLAKGARRVRQGVITDHELSAGMYVPQRVAALMSLTAARSQWTSSWHVAALTGRASRRADDWLLVEGALGVTDPMLVPLRPWAEVLTATPTIPVPAGVDQSSTPGDVLAFILGLLDDISPHAAVRVRQSGRHLSNGDVLANWATNIDLAARGHVNRIHLMRHRVVHEGILNASGAREVAQVAEHTLDAVFEVLAQWMPQPNGHAPWFVLNEVQGRAFRALTAWRGPAPPAAADPASILRR
jgi:hypothetical protein